MITDLSVFQFHCVALQDPSMYGEDIVKLVMREAVEPKVKQ